MAGIEVATGQPVETRRPHPVTTVGSGKFDTSQGTVYLVLGCGGTDANLDVFSDDAVRHEALSDRAEVEGLRRLAVAAAG